MSKSFILATSLVLCLLTAPSVFGKQNFLPGYLINLQGDTIQGFIDYQEWSNNPEEVGFKESKYRTPVYYGSHDIHGFGVLDKHFVSANVQREISPFKDHLLEADPNLHLEWVHVFLQKLVASDKSLYYLKDADDKEHFYILEDTSLTLLLHKVYIEYSNNVRKEYHNMRYIGQLTRYFWDRPDILKEIANTYYSRSDLESLFEHYLKKTGQKKAFVNQDSRVTGTYGIVAGTSVTMLGIETDYLNAGFGPSVNFTGGFSADFAMAGNFRNWSFYNELLYSSYKSDNTYSHYLPAGWEKFDFKYLKLNSMVRYDAGLLFFGAGLSNGLCIDHYGSDDSDFRTYEIGLLFGAGIRYKRFSLELREDLGDGMSPFIGMYTHTERFQMLLGYKY
jgi:hypothetical protein